MLPKDLCGCPKKWLDARISKEKELCWEREYAQLNQFINISQYGSVDSLKSDFLDLLVVVYRRIVNTQHISQFMKFIQSFTLQADSKQFVIYDNNYYINHFNTFFRLTEPQEKKGLRCYDYIKKNMQRGFYRYKNKVFINSLLIFLAVVIGLLLPLYSTISKWLIVYISLQGISDVLTVDHLLKIKLKNRSSIRNIFNNLLIATAFSSRGHLNDRAFSHASFLTFSYEILVAVGACYISGLLSPVVQIISIASILLLAAYLKLYLFKPEAGSNLLKYYSPNYTAPSYEQSVKFNIKHTNIVTSQAAQDDIAQESDEESSPLNIRERTLHSSNCPDLRVYIPWIRLPN
tara:strand:+ start:17675 stop:18715 length:1041 start_codon:yes stop_codon:yes gene_type:complete